MTRDYLAYGVDDVLAGEGFDPEPLVEMLTDLSEYAGEIDNARGELHELAGHIYEAAQQGLAIVEASRDEPVALDMLDALRERFEQVAAYAREVGYAS